MIRNLLLVALRNFTRDKRYSLLNILGLTIGITFSLFLIFYIKDELSYDRYHKKADRIYRINSYIKEKDKDMMNWADWLRRDARKRGCDILDTSEFVLDRCVDYVMERLRQNSP